MQLYSNAKAICSLTHKEQFNLKVTPGTSIPMHSVIIDKAAEYNAVPAHRSSN